MLIAVVLLSGLTAWLGMAQAPIPAAEHDSPPVPLWRLLALAVAVLPVLSLHSPLADLELVATRRLHRRQRSYLAAGCLITVSGYLGSCALVLDPAVVAMIARSWPGWLGLALLAGAVLGWRLAWTVPVAVVGVMLYWGPEPGGVGHRWWEFSARPYDDLSALLVSAALLVAGLLGYAATPWRRRPIARMIKVRKRPLIRPHPHLDHGRGGCGGGEGDGGQHAG